MIATPDAHTRRLPYKWSAVLCILMAVAAVPARATPSHGRTTTWRSAFPAAAHVTGCTHVAPSTTCTHSATARSDGAVELAAGWSSNPAPGESGSFGQASAIGDVGGSVYVPRGATRLSITVAYVVTREVSTTATPWAVSYFDQQLFALPPDCRYMTCGQVASATLACSTPSPLGGAPSSTVPAGTTGSLSLDVTGTDGRPLEAGSWTLRNRFFAHAQNGQSMPLQQASVSGALDVTSLTTTVTVSTRDVAARGTR